MSTFVDERVVEMSFDNKHFEKNVKTSMSTIDKLKNSLNFSDIDTNSLTTGIGGIGKGFSTLEIMGISALANLTSRLVDFGIEIVKTISGIDQLGAGWAKFQEVAISEATLLAQGYDKDVVSTAIEDLLWFTDETSYSFTEMMNNMSKFTAAGIALDDAKNSMMGIANWAALSGQNAGVASRVMYQLSQAMGSGVIKLQDWKSVETANMATKEFKDEILKTAVAMGTLTQNVDGTYNTLTGKTFEGTQFRDFLSEGFLTSDVLTMTLEKYSSVANEVQKMMEDDSSLRTASKALEKYEDQIDLLEASITDLMTAEEKAAIQRQVDDARFGINAFRAAQEARTLTDAINSIKDAVSTGWTRIFREIFGGVDEAKKLWTDLANGLYDIFMDGMWKKIEILEVWSELGGRDDLWANTEETTGAFWNLFNAIKSIKDLIGGAWKNVFGFSDLDDYDKEVDDIGNKLKNLTSQLKDWSAGVSKFFRDPTEEMNNLLLDTAASIGQIMPNVDGTYTDLEGNILDTNEALEKLKLNLEVMKHVQLGKSRELAELEKRKQILEVFTNILKGLFSTLKIIGKTVIAVAKGFSPLIEVIKSALGYLLSALGTVGKEITDFSETTDVFEKITEKIRLFSTTVINFVKTFIKYFRESLNKVVGDTDTNSAKLISFRTVIESIVNVFKWFGEIISKYVAPFLSKFFKVLGIGLGWIVENIIKLVVSIKGIVIGFIEWFKTNQRIQNGLLKLKNVLDIVGETFKKVIKNIAEFFKSFGNSDMAPVEEFSGEIEEKFTPLKTFIEGLSNIFQGLWHVIKAFIPAIGALFSFIGNALKSIGDKLKAIFTTGDGEVNFAKIFTVGFWAVVAVGIYRFADMLRSITDVIRDAFDSMWDYFNSKAIKAYMEALKTMAISILLMVAALLILGSMDESALKKSLLAMTALVGFIVGTMILMKKLVVGTSTLTKSGGIFKGIKDMTTTHSNLAGLAAAFIGLGLAILLLATSLKIISKMDPKELMYGLGIIAIMMVMMTTVMKVLQKSEKSSNKVVRSMVKVAASVALLVRPLKTIGSIDTTTGIKGLIGIASLMAILAMFSRFSKAIDKSQKSVFGLISTAIALTILIIPLKVIGGMDVGSLLKAGGSILGLFVLFVVMGKIVSVEDSEKLKGITKNLIGVAFALGLFGVAMMIVGRNDWSSIGKSAASLVGVFAIMVIMNKVLGKQLTKPRVTNMTDTIKSLKGVAVGLAMLGGAMLVVGLNDWSSVGKSIVTLLGVFGALVIMNKVLGKQLTKPRVSNMNNLVWMLIPLSIGLTSFGLAMLVLGSISWIKIISSLGAVLLTIAVIALLNKGLKATGTGVMSMLAIAGMLVILASSMIILSIGILALGSIPITKLAIALGALAATLVVLGLAAYALMASGATAALLALSVIMIIFSAAVFLLAVALTMFIGVMAVSSAAFAAGLIAMSGALVVAAPMMMKALWTLIEGILQVVIKSIPLLVEALKTLVIEVLGAIDSLVEPLMNTIETLLTGLLCTINTIMPMIIETLVNFLDKLLDGLTTIFPKILITLVDLIMQLLDALVLNVPIFADKLVNMFIGLIQTLRLRLPEVMMELSLYIADLIDGAVAAIVVLIPRLINAGFDLIIGLMDGIGDAIVERAPELRESIKEFCKNIWEAILSFFGINSPSTKMMEVAGNLILGLLKGLWDGIGKLISSIGQWAGQVMGKIGEFFGSAWQKGKDLINNIGNGAKSVWNSTKNWFSGAADDIGSFFKNTATSMSSKGKEIFNNLKSGASGIWSSVSSWFKTKATDISESFKNKVGTMKTVGGDLINGLKSGLQETGEKIKGTVENVANKVTGWFKNIFGIKSPSKVFAEMGMFLDLGLAKGIKDHSDLAYDAAQDLGDDTAEGVEKSGLSKVLTDLNKSLESDFDNEVVIRPVLDLSEIQNGKNRLSNMMSDMDSYDISGSNLIANRTRDEINRDSTKLSNNSKDGSGQGVSNSEVINNTFHITGANAKDIADEVSRVLQIQVDRRKAKWAL